MDTLSEIAFYALLFCGAFAAFFLIFNGIFLAIDWIKRRF